MEPNHADTALLTDLHLYKEAVGIVPPHDQDCLCLGADESWHPGNHGSGDRSESRGSLNTATSNAPHTT
jgi:hypothetical protein